MRERRDLVEFWQNSTAKQFVLATITNTEGSTYRKVGAQKLIAADGSSCGLLSGGCLEGDIVRNALAFLDGATNEVVFDSSSEQDRLLGYQKGCRGRLSVSYSRLGVYTIDAASIMFIESDRALDLKIFGAGADATPLSELAHFMGWPHEIIDHRSDLLERTRFKFASRLVVSAPDEAAKNLSDGDFVVVMSHNFEADLNILKSVVEAYAERNLNLSYFGFLGPKSRFEQLEKDLFEFYQLRIQSRLKDVVRAPVGIIKTGSAPTEIALSLVTEIQSVFASAAKSALPDRMAFQLL